MMQKTVHGCGRGLLKVGIRCGSCCRLWAGPGGSCYSPRADPVAVPHPSQPLALVGSWQGQGTTIELLRAIEHL